MNSLDNNSHATIPHYHDHMLLQNPPSFVVIPKIMVKKVFVFSSVFISVRFKGICFVKKNFFPGSLCKPGCKSLYIRYQLLQMHRYLYFTNQVQHHLADAKWEQPNLSYFWQLHLLNRKTAEWGVILTTTYHEHKLEFKVFANTMICPIVCPLIVVRTNRISAPPQSTALSLYNLWASLIPEVKA